MGVTTNRNDPDLKTIDESGMQRSYLVLSKEEIDKGFVRPLRRSYIHRACGVQTVMGLEIAQTYASNPLFYNATYCCGSMCKKHFPLFNENGEPNFFWDDKDLDYDPEFNKTGIPVRGKAVGDPDPDRISGIKIPEVNIYELCDRATQAWGTKDQVLVAIEEMSELAKELLKNINRGKQNIRETISEIADVQIMMTQLQQIYGFDAVEKERHYRWRRLEKKLNEQQ